MKSKGSSSTCPPSKLELNKYSLSNKSVSPGSVVNAFSLSNTKVSPGDVMNKFSLSKKGK